MNYIGSKHKLINFINKAIELCDIDDKESTILCDLFAGTGRVGRHYKEKGFSIIANDLEAYSYSLISHYIGNHKEIDISKEIEILNQLEGIESGFIFNHYCTEGKHSLTSTKKKNPTTGKMEDTAIHRSYFSNQNGKIIDEARTLVEQWLENKGINQEKYQYLIAVILEAADKVANTASVYGAFLKKIKASAQKKIQFSTLDYATTEQSHQCFNQNANELIKNIQGDILYLDPPYNGRQYGANYHVLNTIAQYDNPKIKGTTGLREYTPSKWCQKGHVHEQLEEIVREAKFNYILFSYNSESIMTPESIQNIMEKYGEYSVITQDYQRFKADKGKTLDEEFDMMMNQWKEFDTDSIKTELRDKINNYFEHIAELKAQNKDYLSFVKDLKTMLNSANINLQQQDRTHTQNNVVEYIHILKKQL